jgi:SAM-dependent methyltransferase
MPTADPHVATAGLAPYEREDVRRATGETLRPGGLTLPERALELCQLPAGSTVLDLGCGTGRPWPACAPQASPPPTGLLHALHDQARTRQVPLLAGRAKALPLASACLDAVFCECVLSAAGEPQATLAEIARVLRPGGLFVLTDLYLRPGPAASPTAKGCVGGAVYREALLDRLAGQGLTPLRFEDHTKLLADLTCRLIFELGSASAVISLITGRDPVCDGTGARPRFGYCLVVAAKEAL